MENQPKKRGRKKKTQVVEAKEPSPTSQLIQIVSTSNEEAVRPTGAVTPSIANDGRSREERQADRIQRANKIESDALKIDKVMNSKRFRDSLMEKFIDSRPGICKTGQNGDYLKLYEQMKQGDTDEKELLFWASSVTYESVKKNCKILGFLLENGPMTKIEDDIFKNCLDTVKSYYNERIRIVSGKTDNSWHFYRTSYFPKEDSNIYKFLFEVEGIPDKNRLYDIFKENQC